MKEDYIDRLLEVDKLFEEGVKLRHVGDNLRSYPVIIAFVIAVLYLWVQPAIPYLPTWVFRIVAVIWGLWIVGFTCLTALQSGFLLSGILAGALKPHYENRPRVKSLTTFVVAITAVIFMFGAFFVAYALYNAVRR